MSNLEKVNIQKEKKEAFILLNMYLKDFVNYLSNIFQILL
jgi:hypothetical protein